MNLQVVAIPMGGIGEGEDPKKRVYREFYEEMGVEVEDDIKSLGRINRLNQVGEVKTILHVFLLDTDTKIIPDLENAYGWF